MSDLPRQWADNSQPQSRQRFWRTDQARRWALPLLLLLLAFALRLVALEQRPLHFDEGINVVFGQGGLANVLATTFKNGDTDPPVHRLALGAWMGLTGSSPFALRYFSVLCGVLWLALCYRLVRRLGLGSAIAALTLLFMAVSAYAVNYTQQAKGYAFAALMASLSFVILDFGQAKIQNSKSKISEAVYVLAIMLMLGTHYYTAPVLLMHWLWLWGAGRGWAALRRLAVLQTLACLPVAMWVLLTIRAVLTGSLGLSDAPPLPPGQLLGNIWTDMMTGDASVFRYDGPLSLVPIILGYYGSSLWRRKPTATWLLGGTLIPLVFTLILQLRIAFFSSRFLFYLLPFGLIPIAAGVIVLARWLTRRAAAL
nr:glycosyltransferase family 39 protein [Anaerolineae bacterium]